MKKLFFILIIILSIHFQSCIGCQECNSKVITWTFDKNWNRLDDIQTETPSEEICRRDVARFYDEGKSRDTTFVHLYDIYIVTQVIPQCYKQ